MATLWPYVLAGVLLAALVIVVLLVLLLRKSAKVAAKYPDPAEKEEPAPPATDPGLAAETRSNLRRVFKRAGRLFQKGAEGGRYEAPLVLLFGAEGSRDEGLLRDAELDLRFSTPVEGDVSLGDGRGFWLLHTGGAVLDVVGDAVLRAEGTKADDDTWSALVRRMVKFRPQRPLDGVVITISYRELFDAARDEDARAQLAARANRLSRRLFDAQQEFGFRLPAYLLITGGEHLPGFTTLCGALPDEMQHEMLGWSSPYNLDAAYRSSWMDEAVAAIAERLDDVQMEIFTAGSDDAGSVLRMPPAVRALSAPLRLCAEQLFRSSAYQSTLIFRGAYLCGSVGKPAVPGEEPEGRTVFLRDLLQRKIFPEWGLAAPTAGTVVADRRLARIMKTVTASLAVVLGAGLFYSAIRLQQLNASILPFLESTRQHIWQLRQNEHSETTHRSLLPWSIDLLDGMSRSEIDRYGALFIPSSWFSSFQDRLGRAISDAFEDVILHAVRFQMKEKARDLTGQLQPPGRIVPAVQVLPPTLTDAPTIQPAMPAPLMPAPVVWQATAPPVVAVEETPPFLGMRRRVDDLAKLEQNARTYNALGTTGSMKDLVQVVEYAFDRPLPEMAAIGRRGRNHIFEQALKHTSYERFNPADYRDAAVGRVEGDGADLYRTLYRDDPLEARLRMLSAALQGSMMQPPTATEKERFTQVVQRMRDVESALSGPQLEWAFRPQFDLGPGYGSILSAVEQSGFLGGDCADRLRRAGGTGLLDYQRKLLSYSSNLTGPLLAARDGRPQPQLSAETLLLKSTLEGFLGQGFVVAAPRNRTITPFLEDGKRLAWDAGGVEQATAVAQAYDRFREKRLSQFPSDLQVPIDQLARERARTEMADLMAGAQRFEQVEQPIGVSMLDTQLSSDIARFAASTQSVGQVYDGFGRVQGVAPRGQLSNVMTAEAYRLLRGVDNLLQAQQPYMPRQGFAWWNGTSPPSPAAWDAADAAQVAVYLETTRGRIAVLARNYAQPLLAWFAKSGTSERADVAPLVDRWQGILVDLRDYDAKVPGNAVAAIEDYITTQMPKVAMTDCRAARPAATSVPQQTYFRQRLDQLSRSLSASCYAIAGREAGKRYARLARLFNQRLAGAYPFAPRAPQRLSDPEADPEDIREFFQLYDASKQLIASMPADSGATYASVRRFMDQMDDVRRFFAPFLDAKNPSAVPAFDVEPAFRVGERELEGNQIIERSVGVGFETLTNRDPKRKLRWVPGEPVRVTLRWAQDGPRVPALLLGDERGAIRERTVTFEYTNRWSLIAALAEHAAEAVDLARRRDVQPITLAFSVYTQPVGGGPPGDMPARVFLRLALLAPETNSPLELPQFPPVAPEVDARVAEADQ